MQIKDMFEKDIDRNIKGVIKVDQNDEENIYQELNEYVVTNELNKHFSEFFNVYTQSISHPTDDMGVWISGFFGSGKSHFLKILSYLLDSNLTVHGRKPIDFFKEDKKIKDPLVIADMEKATSVDTDVILFNIDAKASSQSQSNILDVFIKVFNEKQGYSGEFPFLADFERKLDEIGKYEEFKNQFQTIDGKTWEDQRDSYYFIQDKILKTVVNIGFMTETEAQRWLDNIEDNYSINIEKFAKQMNEYCKSKGKNHRIVFLVDEVGQYIAENTKLMLNLQTLVEELGVNCHGKVWVIVTSQQNIDDITAVKGQDFSKIQGRFKTRLSLSSSNVDEVIRKRVLEKNKTAEDTLEAEYPNVESKIKNIITFEKSAEMKNYKNSVDFASFYPFIPYQFNLVQNVLTSIREHSASGKHLADGERSMLALFQEATIEIENEDKDALVPFNIFYKSLDKFIDHTHSGVINKAQKNDYLDDFDVEVLKSLFMIKYVKEIKSTSKNITTLMINNINEDRIALNKKIDKSLKKLYDQTLIQKNNDVYYFLTNEEQDINREIKNEIIDGGEIQDDISNIIFQEIYTDKSYKYNDRYNFKFNKAIDDKNIITKYDIGLRIITPLYDYGNIDTHQTTLTNNDNRHNILKTLSEENNEVIVQIPDDMTVFDDLKETLQIQKYLRKNSQNLKAELKARKQEEYNDKRELIRLLLEEALKNANIYVRGDRIDLPEKNVELRLNESLKSLINEVYIKLSYMDFAPNESDVKKAIGSEVQTEFEFNETRCHNALNDLDQYISNHQSNFEQITLKDIFKRFSSAPYGFQDIDIEWLVATLFSQKRIALTINSNEITLKKDGSQKIFNYLNKKNQYSEKLIISKKKEISGKKIKTTKTVFEEVFSKSISTKDSETMMEEYKKENEILYKKIEKALSEFRIFDKYPGKTILEEAKEINKEINNLENTSEFFNYLFEQEDDILEINDELKHVLSFFESPQKKIFKEAYDMYDIYYENKNLINSPPLDELADNIKKILDMPNPYSQISNLPGLKKEINNIIESILNEKREIIDNTINDDYENVINNLTTDELVNKYGNEIKTAFEQLHSKLYKEKNIAIISGISQESDNLRKEFNNKIRKYNSIYAEHKQETQKKNTNNKPVESDVDITRIISKTKITIKNNQDLEEFLNQIKTEIKKELDSDKIVNLRL